MKFAFVARSREWSKNGKNLSPNNPRTADGVRNLPLVASAGHFAACFKPNSSKLYNFNPNKVQNYFSMQVYSVVSTPLELAASRNVFTRRTFLQFPR